MKFGADFELFVQKTLVILELKFLKKSLGAIFRDSSETHLPAHFEIYLITNFVWRTLAIVSRSSKEGRPLCCSMD